MVTHLNHATIQQFRDEQKTKGPNQINTLAMVPVLLGRKKRMLLEMRGIRVCEMTDLDIFFSACVFLVTFFAQR